MSLAAPDPDATLAAQARLQALFRGVDRLTPDELARIGYRPAPDEEREALLAAVDEAAARTGRTALVDGARSLAWSAVMRRLRDGTPHPTWLMLNWGPSSGTVEDRVAIAKALADAAAATVVQDALDPEVAEALELDAAAILGPAGALASAPARVSGRRPRGPHSGPPRIVPRPGLPYGAPLSRRRISACITPFVPTNDGPSTPRTPFTSVTRPPASSMTTIGPAMSHDLQPVSNIASPAPSATRA